MEATWESSVCHDTTPPLACEIPLPTQWRMQDVNQGGAKTMEMLICMKI
jgi:hypothetical protein